MSISFGGINIHTKEPEKSFEFYRGLGLEVKTQALPGDDWYGAEFDIGGGSLLWIWRDHEGVSSSDKPPIQIVLRSADIEGDYARLIENGYAVSAPELMFYGGKEMRLIDPDQNSILILD